MLPSRPQSNEQNSFSNEVLLAVADHEFIVLAPNNWHGLWMNRQQLMSRLGQYTEVLYSRGPWFMWDRKKALSESGLFGSCKKEDNVFVDQSPAVMLRWPKVSFLDTLAKKQFAKRLDTISRKKSQEKKRVLYVFHPTYLDYVDLIPHDMLVYHCYDNFISMPDGERGIEEKERELCQRADKIFTSSEANRDRFAQDYKRDDTVFLPNGVDFPLFNDSPSDAPGFLDVIKSDAPRVGYVGSVNDKVDLKIVDALTEEKPGVNFVFVGRVNNLSSGNAALWSRIAGRNNVYHYPPCAREIVPQVLKNMSVNCIYYDLSGDNFSSAGYPLKLHEYLASGVPAVSSGIRAVQAFENVVGVANNAHDWSGLIDRAINTPQAAPSSQEIRIETARENSWDNRIVQLVNHLFQKS